jgi:hypothetical protein
MLLIYICIHIHTKKDYKQDCSGPQRSTGILSQGLASEACTYHRCSRMTPTAFKTS